MMGHMIEILLCLFLLLSSFCFADTLNCLELHGAVQGTLIDVGREKATFKTQGGLYIFFDRDACQVHVPLPNK